MSEPSISMIDEKVIELARSIDQFEEYSSPHAGRIAGLADAVGQGFNLSSHDRQILKTAALLHDLGEMVMARDYISVERILTDRERMDMERHPVIGEQEAAKRGFARAVQLLIRWHHEWWNGTGYPDCLKRDSIPLGARILRVCDTYAAMTDARPYSVPITSAEARRYLSEWAGIEFDPQVVKTFLELPEMAELESLSDHDAP
jgi:putative nucleotidyltransferase with HDIG domain